MKIKKTNFERSPLRPLQVYLDSSDYSVLSKSMEDTNKPYSYVFRKLCSLVDQEKIEIRFSAIHVIEIAHLRAASKRFALPRAKCLQRLSNGKCFRYWPDILVAECASVLAETPPHENVISDHGFWHPDLSESAQSLKQIIIEEFKALAERHSLNRQQRKTLERRYFPKGRLSSEGVRFLQRDQMKRKQMLAALSEQFPFGERFYRDDLMLKYASGKASEHEVIDEMNVVFRDIEKFIGWTYDTRDKERKLVSSLRKYGSELVFIIERLQNQYGSLGDISDATRSRIFRNLKEKAMELRRSRLNTIKEELIKQGTAPSDSAWHRIINSPLGSLPALDTHIASFYSHFRRNVLMKRKKEASDVADLLHMIHIPYCDLFRADSDAAQVAGPLALPYDCRVVQKLQELPQAIDESLS